MIEGVKKLLRSINLATLGNEPHRDWLAKEICQLFEQEDEPEWLGARHLNLGKGEPKPDYTLSCDNCGKPFSSTEGFPSPQLCPKCQAKPNESRLLTDEIRDIARKMITASHYNNLPDSEFDNYLNSILAKTASIVAGEWASEVNKRIDEFAEIKDAECQQRVERILSRMNMRDVGGIEPEWALSNKDYEALKKQEGIEGEGSN